MHHLPSWPKVVFFDGTCILCNRMVDFLIRMDHRKKLRFATLQSAIAEKYLSDQLPGNPEIDTVIYFGEGRIYKSSTAILKVLSLLGFPWNLTAVLYIIPQGIRDRLYNLIAQKRYSWFGRKQLCRVPDEWTRDRIMG